jgi:hypothetical protein
VTKLTGISLLSTSYKILSNILLSRLDPYIDERKRRGTYIGYWWESQMERDH